MGTGPGGRLTSRVPAAPPDEPQIDRLAPAAAPPGTPVGHQKWRHLAFLHWRCDPAAVQNAQRAIDKYVKMAPEARGMATTLTLLYLDGDGATLAHMGDSRIYHLRGRQLVRRTQDHSLVQEMVSNDLLTPEQARNHPQRNVITRAINEQVAAVGPEVLELRDLRPEDLFFLCSDGILEAFDDEGLIELLTRPTLSDTEKMATIEARCTEHSRDNFTACLIRLQTVGATGPADDSDGTSVASFLKTLLANVFG